MNVARIRIAVAVDENGAWVSNGDADMLMLAEVAAEEFVGEINYHYIEVEIPAAVPRPVPVHAASVRGAA